MKQKPALISLPIIHPSLNQWAIAWNKFKRHKEKKEAESYIYYSTLSTPKFSGIVNITFTYYMPTHRKQDPDNYTPKFFLDALVKANIIEDDSSRIINSLTIKIRYDKINPRTEIFIEPYAD